MAKPIIIIFIRGVQLPPKLATVILKLAGEGKSAYAQNVDVGNDEYGLGVAVPGPLLTTIGNNTELTGVPFARSFYHDLSANIGYMHFLEGLLGATDFIRRVKDIEPGETPSIDTAGDIQIVHSAHSNVVVDDLAMAKNAANDPTVYILGKDATDRFLLKILATGAPSLTTITATANFSGGIHLHRILIASDTKLYIASGNRIDSVLNDDTTVSASVLTLPKGYAISELVEWQLKMVMAYSKAGNGIVSFNDRKGGTSSGIVLWNFTDPSFERDFTCPSRYISAMIVSPTGQLIIFGGLDEGKTTIYEFNGYGFNSRFSYIGEMPRNRHSVDFDGMGRLIWQTADGQLCRLDLITGFFEHIATMTTGSSAGGLLGRAVGGNGNEFLIASGSGSTYTMKLVQFGSFSGDGAAATDGITTPLVISGVQAVPNKSNIQSMTTNLAKPLASSEKIEVRLYKNGSTDYTVYMTMSYNDDGAISSKKETKNVPDINNFSIGIAWKMADGATTAPPVVSVDVEVN